MHNTRINPGDISEISPAQTIHRIETPQIMALEMPPRLPSLKLTFPLKIDNWKGRFLLETIIFRGYLVC